MGSKKVVKGSEIGPKMVGNGSYYACVYICIYLNLWQMSRICMTMRSSSLLECTFCPWIRNLEARILVRSLLYARSSLY